MYKITIQTLTGEEKTLYYPGSEEYVVSSAVLSLKVGSAGEFNFTVPLDNPLYDEVVDHAIITIYEDNAEMWRGDIRDIQQNFDKSLAVYVLEDLAWLGEETVEMTAIENQTYLQRFAAAMNGYNANQPSKRRFLQGYLTSVTATNTCHWLPQYEETLLDCIRRCIADDGYLKIRRVPSTGANGVTVTFDSRTKTESGFDFIDLYYEQGGTYYKRALSGNIGDLSVYIPSTNFWLHWHTDGSVTEWGWKISSIVPQASGTPTGFSAATLPSATWSTVIDTSNLPESNHNYSSNENAYYKFELPSERVIRYLDIVKLEDYGTQAAQKIEFGSNLLDFVKEIDHTNFVNALYPYGKETEEVLYGEVMKRVVGTPIQNDVSIAAFGRHARSVVFETDSETTLNRLALAYLNRYSQPSMKIQGKAIDLGNIEDIARLHLGDSVRIIARPFSVDQWYYLTHQDLDLLDIANNQVELSDSVRVQTITSQIATQAEEIKDLPSPFSVLEAAKENALKILEGTDGGIVTFVINSDGQITEQRILNNLDYDQATKAWRWTLGGLAYLHRTYPSDSWQVGIAMTMDGQIVADFITTGSLTASVMQTNVISAINNQYLKIEAKNIDITGAVTFNDFTSSVQNTINGKANSSDLNNYPTKTSLQTGTTTINGGCITTGNIQSGNYSETSSSSDFSTSGTKFDLDNGLIKSKNFRIDNNGGKFGLLNINSANSEIYTLGRMELCPEGTVYNLESKQIYIDFYICPYKQGYTENYGIYYNANVTVSSGTHSGVVVGKVSLYKRQAGSSTSSLVTDTNDISVGDQYTYLVDRYSGGMYYMDKNFGANDNEVYVLRFRMNINNISWLDKLTLWVWLYGDQSGAITKTFSVSPDKLVGNYFGTLNGSADLFNLKCASAEINSVYHGSEVGMETNFIIRKKDDFSKYMLMKYNSLTKYDNGTSQQAQFGTSDRRAKENIIDLDTELSKRIIDGSVPVTFKYKHLEGRHYGLVAQDARELLDELGETDVMLEHSMGLPESESGIKDQRTIDYNEYIAPLINYVKDLQKQINELTEEIKILKEER